MYTRRTPSNVPIRLAAGFVIVSLVVIGFVAYQALQNETSSVAPTPIVALSSPTPAPYLSPTPVLVEYRIISSKANLSTVITELYYAVNGDNWDLTHLGQFAGHLEGTANFGTRGNFVLAGHVELRDGSQGPFADIHLLTTGDAITIIGATQPTPTIKEYVVTDEAKVAPNAFGVMRNHGYEELTLITCDDWNATNQTYTTRVIVHARPVNGAPPGH